MEVREVVAAAAADDDDDDDDEDDVVVVVRSDPNPTVRNLSQMYPLG